MHCFRLKYPTQLLSVSYCGNSWYLDDTDDLQLSGKALVVWRCLLIVPLRVNGQRQWLWLWWFRISADQLALLRLLALSKRRG
ncbi:MAG: hypothetical protein ACQEQZ_05660 [Pseudomonadota bacterium]